MYWQLFFQNTHSEHLRLHSFSIAALMKGQELFTHPWCYSTDRVLGTGLRAKVKLISSLSWEAIVNSLSKESDLVQFQ